MNIKFKPTPHNAIFFAAKKFSLSVAAVAVELKSKTILVPYKYSAFIFVKCFPLKINADEEI